MSIVNISNPYYRSVDEQKEQQQQASDKYARDGVVSVEPPEPAGSGGTRCQRFVQQAKLDRILKALGDVAGKRVLIVCGGVGDFGVRQLVDAGAQVTLTDLSPGAVAFGRERWRRFANVTVQIADAEALPFADGSFDIVYCHAGLHHLPRPVLGIFEMYRVARSRVLFVEAQDSLALRLLVKLGLAEDWEPSGNYVYRFSRREIHKLCTSLGARSYEVSTFFNQYSVLLNERVYPWLDNTVGATAFQAFYRAFNRVLGGQGNVFIAAIDKPRREGDG